MQSILQILSVKQIVLMNLKHDTATWEEITNIIPREDFYKDVKFILNKYPRVAQVVFENNGAFGVLKDFLEIEKNKPEDERKEFWEDMDMLCNAFMKAPAYKNGNKKHNGYKICCEMADYCSFYKQTWFFIVCGAVGFLLLVAIAAGVFFIIRRKNKKMGGGNMTKGGNTKKGGSNFFHSKKRTNIEAAPPPPPPPSPPPPPAAQLHEPADLQQHMESLRQEVERAESSPKRKSKTQPPGSQGSAKEQPLNPHATNALGCIPLMTARR